MRKIEKSTERPRGAVCGGCEATHQVDAAPEDVVGHEGDDEQRQSDEDAISKNVAHACMLPRSVSVPDRMKSVELQ